VKVIFDVVEEEFVHGVWGFNSVSTCLCNFLHMLLEWSLHLISDFGEFFAVVDIRHQSTVQHILDIFQETVLNRIIIREDKDGLQFLFTSEGSDFIHHLNEFSEVSEVESFCHFKLEDVHLSHEG
jgi:hypothetical protein